MNQQGRIHDYFKFNEIKTNLDPGRKFFTNSYGLVCVLTFFWLSLGSFKTGAQLNNPALLLFKPTLENWKEVLRSGVLESAYRSATVGLVTVSLSVVIDLWEPTQLVDTRLVEVLPDLEYWLHKFYLQLC